MVQGYKYWKYAVCYATQDVYSTKDEKNIITTTKTTKRERERERERERKRKRKIKYHEKKYKSYLI